MAVRVVPVLDLRGGLAVHARGGAREGYRPVRSRLDPGSDPLDLAHAYRDRLGLDALYVADLDAIAGAPPDTPLYRRLANLGLELWVDAGALDARRLGELRASGVARVIAATETLAGPAGLADLAATADPDTLIFGLDLRAGRPIVAPWAGWPSNDPLVLVGSAWEAGLRRFVVLDLARVGAGGGVSGLDLAAALVRAFPGAEVAVGGGVAGPGDLRDAEAAGATAVLVGSALHDGRLTRDDLTQTDPAAQTRST